MINKVKYIFLIVAGIFILLFPLVGGFQIIRNVFLCWIPDENFWFGYMSYVGAILAVFTALFIVKWEYIIKSKKILKIQWNHTFRGNVAEICWVANNKTKDNNKYNYILLKLCNTGNKIITISSIKLEFYNKHSVILATEYFMDKTYFETDIKYPRKLDVDEYALLHIPVVWFGEVIITSIENGYCTPSDKIIIVVNDITDKTYRIKINIDYSYYLQCYEKYKQEA